MAYSHKNAGGVIYYLHKTEVTLRGSGRRQTIYYFKKNADSRVLDDLPAGYTVVESKRSGLPVLRKK